MRIHAHRRLLLPLALVPLGAAVLAGVPGTASAATSAAGTTAAGATVSPGTGPDYEMPFPCGDRWNGSSRYNHSPSALSIDWNRTNDLGAMTVATAPGVVTSVVDLGDRSYGRYIVVDHGGGHTSLYAHLSAQWVSVGQAVDQGTPIGLVGSSGGSTGPHLHFEERLDRRDQRAYFHRTSFTMGTTATSQSCGDVPVAGDWDGNGTTDIGVQRRGTSPTYHLRRADGATVGVPFGWRTDQPVTGDWNGDGKDDLGARRAGAVSFVLRNPNGSTSRIGFGRIGDAGVSGDWDGDGRSEVGVWRPSTRTFFLRAADGTTTSVALGSTGDRPVTGDWNGDHRTDLGVWTASTATFTLRAVARSGAVTLTRTVWGNPGCLPVSGDWDGDGTGDVGVWDPVDATFTLRVSPTRARATAVTRTARWGLPRG
jgi:hypothetical protein